MILGHFSTIQQTQNTNVRLKNLGKHLKKRIFLILIFFRQSWQKLCGQ